MIYLSIALIMVSMFALCVWCCLIVASDADDAADEMFRVRRLK